MNLLGTARSCLGLQKIIEVTGSGWGESSEAQMLATQHQDLSSMPST